MLQVNLGKLNTVTAVATQGERRGTAFVRSYQLAFSRQEGEWFYYKEHGEVKVSSFSARNCDTQLPGTFSNHHAGWKYYQNCRRL